MNKAFKRLTVLIIIAATFSCAGFLVACGFSNNPHSGLKSYEYTRELFEYEELYNNAYKQYSAKKTSADYATYYFDNLIASSECDRFISLAEQLLDYIKPQEKPLTFFVSKDIKIPRAEENMLYFSMANAKTIEFINYVLQAVNTNTLNYGLLHGMSNNLLAELKWGESETPQSETQITDFLKQEKNRSILDLTYPVFQKKFFTDEQIKYAKSISIMLVNYIEKTHGKAATQELFEADLIFDLGFDNLFYGYLNEWLDIMEVDNVQISSEVMKCIPYTIDFPYRMLTNSCDYFMDKDWKDSGLADHYVYRDFKFNYQSVKNVLLKAEASYALVRGFFDYNESEKCPVLLQYMELYGGVTYAHSNYIVISSMYALTHEYAHLISFVKQGVNSSWLKEGIANYCQVMFDDLYSNEYYAMYAERESFIKVIGEIGEVTVYVLDNYVDASTDENFFMRFLEGYFYVLFFELDYNLYENFNDYLYVGFFAISLSDFLVKTYGKEKYIQLYGRKGYFEDIYDESQKELIDRYLQYIYDIFN